MSCPCSELDWTGVDQTARHHPDCNPALQATKAHERLKENPRGYINADEAFANRMNGEHTLSLTGIRVQRNAHSISDIPEYKPNWTCDESGRSNSSYLFNFLSKEIASLIRNGAFDIVSGQTDQVARLIVAHLAHKYNVGPLSHFDENTPPPSWDKLHSDELNRLRAWRDKLYHALPFWMGFNSAGSDEFLGGLLAWIAAHRYGSPDYFALEQSWRLQHELRTKAEEQLSTLLNIDPDRARAKYEGRHESQQKDIINDRFVNTFRMVAVYLSDFDNNEDFADIITMARELRNKREKESN